MTTRATLHNQLSKYFEDLQTLLSTKQTTPSTTIVLKLEQYIVVTKDLREVQHVLSLSATINTEPNILVSAPHSMQDSVEENLWRMGAMQTKMLKLIEDNTYDIDND